jgi:hypothetical protein
MWLVIYFEDEYETEIYRISNEKGKELIDKEEFDNNWLKENGKLVFICNGSIDCYEDCIYAEPVINEDRYYTDKYIIL